MLLQWEGMHVIACAVSASHPVRWCPSGMSVAGAVERKTKTEWTSRLTQADTAYCNPWQGIFQNQLSIDAQRHDI